MHGCVRFQKYFKSLEHFWNVWIVLKSLLNSWEICETSWKVLTFSWNMWTLLAKFLSFLELSHLEVGWMSVRQLMFFHTVLQAHKTISTGVPRPLHAALSTYHPYDTRSASSGKIRLGESCTSTFKYRAMVFYNSVPGGVRKGSLPTVKRKLKQWVLRNVPLDWG